MKIINQPLLLVIGSSGSGKTTLLLHFIYKKLIPYANLYIFSKLIRAIIKSNITKGLKYIELNNKMKYSYFIVR